MKILKILYLVFGAAVLVDLVSSFYTEQEVYRVFFWETNVWWYRIDKVVFLMLFAGAFWEQQKREKLKSE